MPFRSRRPVRQPGAMRRGPRLFGRHSALGGAPLRRLAEAHQLFAAGEAAAAAALYGELASAAQAAGMPLRAAHLHMQAARGLYRFRQPASARGHVQAALALWEATGQPAHAWPVFQALIRELRDVDRTDEADELLRPYGAGWHDEPPAPARAGGRLPTHCPQCGGPLSGNEVEWLDDRRAVCPYCGSPLEAG